MLVFLKESTAKDRGSHWFGGPDFAVEIVSPGDRTLEILSFYAGVNTKELLIIDRNPWQLTLYRRNDDGTMESVATSTLQQASVIESEVLSAQFASSKTDACLRVIHAKGTQASNISINLDVGPNTFSIRHSTSRRERKQPSLARDLNYPSDGIHFVDDHLSTRAGRHPREN